MNRLARIFLAGSTFMSLALASAFAINLPALPANADSAPQLFPTLPPLHIVSLKVTTDATSSTKVGDTFNYVLELKNDTAQDKTVSVTDTLPTEVALVVTPTLELSGTISTTPIAPIVISNTVSWRGTLPKDASAKLHIQVKLIACAASQGQDGRSKSISNIAVLRVENNGLSVSGVSFRPSACNDPTPTPKVTPGPTPSPTPVSTSTLPADVAVVKFGRLHLDWARPERGWQASWYVGYQNRSERTANEVVINDSPSSNQTLLALRSWPSISPTTTSTGLQFNIGSLARWRGGSIWLRTTVPVTTTASTVLTNSVSISASNDARLDNNSALVTITLPALPPSITYPRSGATCTETITVTGKAQANAALQVFVDGSPVLTTTANSAGNWSASVKLDEGINVLVVRTVKSGNEPEHDGDDWGGWGDYRQSNSVYLKVDTDLKWDPISLNFTDPSGDKKYARHWLGWFEEIGWYVGVQPSTTYTVGVRICCQELTATVTLTVPSGIVTPTVINLTDPDGDRIYTGVWTTGNARDLMSGKLTLCVRGDGVLRCARGRAYPIWPKANHTVFITEDGFDAAKLSVVPGEVVEFVNMDVKARAFSSSANLAAQANGAESLNADDDAVRLEVGESYSVQVSNTQVTYYDSQNSTESITLAPSGNAVYLPFVTR